MVKILVFKKIFMMIKDRYIKWVLNIILVFILILLGLVCYWSMAKYDVLTPQEGNYLLSKTTYKQGEVLDIHLSVCKNLSYPESVHGMFVDGVIYSVPENTTNFEVGCYDTYLGAVSIPDGLPTGKYVYKEEVVYQVNPIRRVVYTFETPEFEVIENE